LDNRISKIRANWELQLKNASFKWLKIAPEQPHSVMGSNS